MLMQTGIYARVSTEEQAKDGFSIHAQKDKLTKYAEINDWDIVDYYVDDGISGKNLTERKEVTRLIHDVESGRVTNVLVYKLDRLTRSVKDLIFLIELFDKHNCTFNSQTEKIDTSNAVGRMFVKIIGIFAEFERENLAERVSFGYEQKTREGNYTNCNGVFGYDYLIGKGRLKVNKEEAKYVQKIYDWYLDGSSMLKIAKKMKDFNVPTKRGGHWNQSTISSILTNPLYIGIIRYGTQKSNGFEVVGKNITPLITNEIFYEVQELINKRKKFKTKKYASDDTYYFKVLRCGKCGGRLHARQQIQRGKKYITYRCNGCQNHSCDAKGFSHNKMETVFLKFLDTIETFDFDHTVLKEKENLVESNEIKKIEEEIKRLTKKRKDTTELFSTDDIDYDTFKQIKNIVDQKINLLNSELESLKIESIHTEPKDEKKIKKAIIDLKTNFIHLNNHEKKMFLERFINKIEVEKIGNEVMIKGVLF